MRMVWGISGISLLVVPAGVEAGTTADSSFAERSGEVVPLLKLLTAKNACGQQRVESIVGWLESR